MVKQLHILIVDDNEELLRTFALIFKRAGYDVETATDGKTAVEKYSHGNFDITLMDVVMPGMNGVEAFRLIHAIKPEAPVVLMTGYCDTDIISSALSEGAICVLNKPLRIDNMIEIIKKTTSARQDANKELILSK